VEQPLQQTQVTLVLLVAVVVRMGGLDLLEPFGMVDPVTPTVAVVEAKQILERLDLLVQVLLCFLIMLLHH
jgi:hypothetical protein